MQIFRNKKLIITLVAALVLSVTAYFLYPSAAYAKSSSNLPVDVDVDVNVDADYIYISNSGNDYTIDRHYDCSYYLDGVRYYPTIIPSGPNKMEYEIGYYPHGDRLSQPVDSFHCCPYTKSYDNTYRYAENPNSSRSISYWYSPSLNFVFAFADNKVNSALYSDDCTVLNFATTSYDAMNYPSVGVSKYVAVPTYLYDLNVGTCSYVFNVFINYCDGNCYLPYCDGSYSAMCMYYYPQNNDSYDGLFHLVNDYWSTYPLYIGPKRYSSHYSSYYGLGSTAYNVNANYLPNDLLCIFSTYTIPGYFTLDNSGYKTPSYYFQYQYLYFKQDSGYVFIDSSSPLDSISRPTDGNCKITFTDYANCHIYISSDGYTWKELTTISTMYCKSFQTTYGYFFGGTSVTDSVFSAVLVYSSDDSLEKEPQFKPTDFPDPTDIDDNLNQVITNHGYKAFPDVAGLSYYVVELPDNGLDFSAAFLESMTFEDCYYCTYHCPDLEALEGIDAYLFDQVDTVHVYFFSCEPLASINLTIGGTLGDAIIKSCDSFFAVPIGSALQNLLVGSSPATYNLVSSCRVGTLGYFQQESANSLLNLEYIITAFRLDTFNQLNSIHGNISSVVSALNVIDDFGINTIIIKTHPTWLISGYEEENIRRIIDYILEMPKDFDRVRFIDNISATCACKMSVKGNTSITMEEAESILNQLVKCDNPYNCPHGRPTIITFTKYELERLFKRVMN